MFIQTQETPNPAVLKFLPGQPVMGARAPEDFPSAQSASRSPLAQRLFEIEGVSGVFFGADFIAVTRQTAPAAAPARLWAQIKPDILGVIMEHFTRAAPLFYESPNAGGGAQSGAGAGDDPLAAKIRELIDQRVRPAVAQDGGDILFERIEDGIVYLTLRGACAGCPSSTATLKQGVEQLLRYYVPEVVAVRARDDL